METRLKNLGGWFLIILLPLCSFAVGVRDNISFARSHRTKDFSNFLGTGYASKQSRRFEMYSDFFQREFVRLFLKRSGIWVSDEQDFSEIAEWCGVKRLRLEVRQPTNVKLLLEYANGEVKEAPSSEPGLITDCAIFFGPCDAGMLFYYVVDDELMYTLFSPHGVQRNIPFRRIEKFCADLEVCNSNNVLRTTVNTATPTMASRRKMLNNIKGFYKYSDISSYTPSYVKGFDEYYLVVGSVTNSTDNARLLYKKKGKFYWYPYWDNECMYAVEVMGEYDGLYGPWVLLDNGDLCFADEPPLPQDEFLEVEMSWYGEYGITTSQYFVDLECEYISSYKSFRRRIDRWKTNSNGKRQIVFKRIPPLRLTVDDFGIECEPDNEQEIKKEREWLQQRLDNMYKLITVEDKK